MEPRRAPHGRIVVIRAGDGIYLKTLRISGTMVYPESINPRHHTIELDGERMDLELIGIVVVDPAK
jgi:SOS-response transcriptional repressor LexA